jgi:hypothetical protein
VATERSSGEGASEREIEAAHLEAEAVAAAHRLNLSFVRASGACDTAWFDEHLRDDFVCTLADGRRINKLDFLQRTHEKPHEEHVDCDDVDVHALVEGALVNGVMHSKETVTLMRYTVIWQGHGGCWQAVAAQFTQVTGTTNPGSASSPVAQPLVTGKSPARRLASLARLSFPIR